MGQVIFTNQTAPTTPGSWTSAVYVDNVTKLLSTKNDAGTIQTMGDVTWPSSAVDSHLAAFDTATGKLLKDGWVIPTTNATHTGDATGAWALTVVALNGTNLAWLTSGILCNATTSGVPHIAVSGTDIKTVNSTSILGSGDITITASGWFWTAITATRTAGTTCTVVGDQTWIFKKWMILKRQESAVDKWAMVSIPSTFSSVTTITFVGCTMASIDSNSFKYAGNAMQKEHFAVAWTLWATWTDVANAFYAMEPYYVLGADLAVGTTWTTNNTTIDINKAGTTMFTTKPTLATTVASSPTPFTADTDTTLALGDRISIDLDAIQTTAAIDLYVKLYLLPARFLNLA